MIFSVIVPFRNEEKYISECIHSLLSQDFPRDDYELIFVDNGSTDSSVSIVKQSRGINLLYEARRNVYAARNRALKTAQGEIIAFTDADCTVAQDWLRQIYQGVKAGGAGILLGRVLLGNKNSVSLRMLEDYANRKSAYVLRKGDQRYYYGYTNNMAVKNNIFKELGVFEEWPVPGDSELLYRYMSGGNGNKVAYALEMEVRHLEVAKPATWFKKYFFYGRHQIFLERLTKQASLTTKMRVDLYREALSENNYSFLAKMLFVALLLTGVVFYESGKLSRRLESLFTGSR